MVIGIVDQGQSRQSAWVYGGGDELGIKSAISNSIAGRCSRLTGSTCVITLAPITVGLPNHTGPGIVLDSPPTGRPSGIEIFRKAGGKSITRSGATDQISSKGKVPIGVSSDSLCIVAVNVAASHGMHGDGVSIFRQRNNHYAGSGIGEERAFRIATDVNLGIQRPVTITIGDMESNFVSRFRGESKVLSGGIAISNINRRRSLSVTKLRSGYGISANRHSCESVMAVFISGCAEAQIGDFYYSASNRIAGVSIGNGALQGTSRAIGARFKLEGADAGVPSSSAVRRVVFLGVPESTTILRVNSHHAVVAPAAGRVALRTAAFYNYTLIAHFASGVAGQTACEVHRGVFRGTSDGIAKRHVVHDVHCNATHPPAVAIAGSIHTILSQAPR